MAKPVKTNGIKEHGPKPELVARAKTSLSEATEFAFNIMKDGTHWYGELQSNATLTAEHVFLYQSLGEPMPDAPLYRKYLLSRQNDDGSWSIAPYYPGCISTSVEAYLALKILGVSTDTAEMRKARAWIRKAGGIPKVRIFTRIFLAQFGLFPWDYVPQLPAEFVLVPASAPVNIYRLSSWARSTVIPLFIIRHHENVYALPNGLSKNNDYLDELWLNPRQKNVPYSKPLFSTPGQDILTLAITAADTAMWFLGGLRKQPLRRYALKRCVRWILEHQEPEGDWAGIIPPMHAGIQALLLQGFKRDDPRVTSAIAAVERFTWQDEASGKRLQSCISPVWDTILMTRGLCLGGAVDKNDARMLEAVRWIKARQQLGPEGDWRHYHPTQQPGGWSFEYNNSWYPDTDDTAAAVLALVNQSPAAVDSVAVTCALQWIFGMQNVDGGWGAFDINNDRLWLNKVPFSDLEALCDPSSADVTGRILEAYGLVLRNSDKHHVDGAIVDAITKSTERALYYLASTQETTGSWYGRWGSNYLYGTCHVTNGLAYFVAGNEMVRDMLDAATSWLKAMQNSDGGWGENLETYLDPSLAGIGPSTPSQTAWGLSALLTTCEVDDPAVVAAVTHLVSTQAPEDAGGQSWPETRYTGTGFPKHFYIGYTLYRHYFPMMALGKWATRAQQALDEKAALRLDDY
ncbi:Hopene cyclase [Moelleriella libera RCEF 2490]|uniref:Terpene cyclase/mutase family member n=1 Tax=Moelleriella libera RCEF 2490 TaxID=1081109 RepID=A0A167ZP61_9HYPO|nr:Hopene cyclase [Moelleriella libera RCEF 2490]